MGVATAVAFANHASDRSSQLARLARGIREYEIGLERTAAALLVAGKDNIISGELPRFATKASGGDPPPDKELRPKSRAMVVERCGSPDVDVMPDGGGMNAWRDRFRSSAQSASEGPLLSGQLRWFPRVDLIDVVPGRIRRSMREAWSGVHVRLLPVQAWARWLPKLSGPLIPTYALTGLVERRVACPARRTPTGRRRAWPRTYKRVFPTAAT